jgi:acyl-coenzyme A thioesterase PaaI-like protein
MSETKEPMDETALKSFLFGLAFVREYAITVFAFEPGAVTIDLPFKERFSGPPSVFPASLVGIAGDVAAVASCLSLAPKGWGVATLDFTIKMTGAAKGDKLRAKGRVLQNGRTTSVGAAEIYAIAGGVERLCGTLLATTRNFEIKA